MRVHPSLAMLLLLLLTSTAMSQAQHRRLEDSSDWWSVVRREEFLDREPPRPAKVLNRRPAESHFQIAGVTIGQDDDFQKARSRFGDAIEVERGDAASGRDQICYVSPSGGIHLIFEFGEGEEAIVYLFEGGPKWKGSELCSTSPDVTASISTTSGLRLGLSLQQVKALLGSPSLASPDKLIYSFTFKWKTTAAGLARLRKEDPDMSDLDFHKNFDLVEDQAEIEAHFTSGKLSYLAISRTGLYY